jgi:hypothetical protein
MTKSLTLYILILVIEGKSMKNLFVFTIIMFSCIVLLSESHYINNPSIDRYKFRLDLKVDMYNQADLLGISV